MDLKIININGTDFIATESGAIFNENGVLTGLIGTDILKSVGLKATENNLTDALQKQAAKKIEILQEAYKEKRVEKGRQYGEYFAAGVLIGGTVTLVSSTIIEEGAQGVVDAIVSGSQWLGDMSVDYASAEAEAAAMEAKLEQMKQNMNKH